MQVSNDKYESLSERWAARFDDRDDEELANEIWARQLAARERAMAEPFKGAPVMDPAAPPTSKTPGERPSAG